MYNLKHMVNWQALSVQLTQKHLASFLWGISKQHSPRCDATERGIPSGAILFAEEMKLKFKITPEAPKNESGLVQMIAIGTSIHH